MKTRIDAVFLDVDDTVTRSDNTISANVVSTVNSLRSESKLVLTSGRAVKSLVQLTETLTSVDYLIGSNGAMISDANGSTAAESAARPIHLDSVGLIVDEAIANNYAICFYDGILWVAAGSKVELQREVSKVRSEPDLEFEIHNFVAEFPQMEVQKILLLGDPKALSKTQDFILSQPQLGLVAFSNWAGSLDIVPPSTNKGSAVEALSAQLNIPVENRMAIGDGINDIPMFGAVGTRVAVANAIPELIEAANFMVPSNDEDGVAIAIRAFIFDDIDAKAMVKTL